MSTRQPVPGVYEGQPRNDDEWAARGVTWTREVPPLPGFYWWRFNELSVPEVAHVEDVNAGLGEPPEYAWTTTRGQSWSGRLGLWWPVPLVMPPVTAVSPS